MTVTLPLVAQEWSLFRVLYRPTWGAGKTSGNSEGSWAAQIMQRPDPQSSGFILESYSRALLPQLGTARLLFRYGIFGDKIIGASQEQAYEQQQGQQWDSSAELGGVPDLAGYEILIQAARAYPRGTPEASEDPVWQLVWWGTCEYQTDEGWGASPIPAGQRTYHCIDALHRLKRWPLKSHGFVGGGVTIAPAYGHPGYNVSPESSRVQGNRDASSTTFLTQSGTTALCHSLPGAGTTWTDLQVIDNLLAVSRPPGEPLWSLTGATDLFGGTSAWPVQDGDTAWDLLVRIVDRARGRGAVRCEFTQAQPTGPVVPILKAYAQINENIEYDEPSGSQVTINGATANGTAVDVDVIGDHRFVEGSLLLGEAEQYQVGYLESQGEPIEVLTTLSYQDNTLEIGWKTTQETAFRALDPENRTDDKWRDVLQLHRLKRGFACITGDGNGGGSAHCDYRCNDDGAVVLPAVSDTSPATIQILDDTPIFLGYNYAAAPVRYDGDSATTYGGDPARAPVRYFIRTDDNVYLEAKETSETFSPKVAPDGFLLETSSASLGYRFFYYTTLGNTGAVYQYNSLAITCAIRLPHRVRMATGDPTSKRRKVITHDGLHLWMAHQSAIWDLDSSGRSAGESSPPKRAANPTSSPPGILRDDRNALARLHALAVAWYGPLYDLLGQQETGPIRRGCSWSLRCCGDIASAVDYDGGGVVYPTPGQLVKYISANGQRLRLMTPVSSYVYDNTTGVSTWTTDWQDLDFRRA